MNTMTAVRKVQLAKHHLRPGRTRHFLTGPEGQSQSPPFTSLAITQFPGDSGFYLMHICGDGQMADTWHQTLDDALHQAEWEFGVASEEWIETNEPF